MTEEETRHDEAEAGSCTTRALTSCSRLLLLLLWRDVVLQMATPRGPAGRVHRPSCMEAFMVL